MKVRVVSVSSTGWIVLARNRDMNHGRIYHTFEVIRDNWAQSRGVSELRFGSEIGIEIRCDGEEWRGFEGG